MTTSCSGAPQKDRRGISVVGAVHGMSGALLWTIYGIVTEVPLIAVANSVTFIAICFIINAQVRVRILSLSLLVAIQLAIALIGIVAVFISEWFIAVVAIAIGGTAIIPQTIRSGRTSHRVGLSAFGL